MPEEPADREKSRYETLFRLASGGMASVFVGTARGAFGFRQLVAIKKPHAHLVANPEYRQALLREARLASLIHHANVVDVRDVEATDTEVSLIMDYVEGATLSEILDAQVKAGVQVPPGVVVRIVLDACAGLHAAHEQTDERGRPLRLVHRDISPQNLLVGVDGLTRVADFGVAKFKRTDEAATMAGVLKGKLAYMAPEYVRGEAIDRRLDVFAMGVVLWEALTCQRLFRGAHQGDTLERVLSHQVPSVSTVVPALGHTFDGIIETALEKDRDRRFTNAAAMGAALESSARAAGFIAGPREVAEVVKSAVGPRLEERKTLIRARLAHEPSVASFELEPGVAAKLLEEAPPGSATLVDYTPSGLRMDASTRVDPPGPALHETLRSEPAAANEEKTKRAPVPAAPPRKDLKWAGPLSAPLRQGPEARIRATTPRTHDPSQDDAISLPMKGGKAGRYGLLFVVITVAVAGAVVGVGRLWAPSVATVSSVSPSRSASSSATPAAPRPSSTPSASASGASSSTPQPTRHP